MPGSLNGDHGEELAWPGVVPPAASMSWQDWSGRPVPLGLPVAKAGAAPATMRKPARSPAATVVLLRMLLLRMLLLRMVLLRSRAHGAGVRRCRYRAVSGRRVHRPDRPAPTRDASGRPCRQTPPRRSSRRTLTSRTFRDRGVRPDAARPCVRRRSSRQHTRWAVTSPRAGCRGPARVGLGRGEPAQTRTGAARRAAASCGVSCGSAAGDAVSMVRACARWFGRLVVRFRQDRGLRVLTAAAMLGFVVVVYVVVVVGGGVVVGQSGGPGLWLSVVATAVVTIRFGPVRAVVQRGLAMVWERE